MTDLRHRLHQLAEDAANGVELVRPSEAPRTIRRGTLAAAVSLGAAIVLVAVGVAVIQLGGDDDVPGPEVRAGNDSVDGGPTAEVAVTFGNGYSGAIDLTLRLLDSEGNVIGDRHWSEVDDTLPDAPEGAESRVFHSMRGLRQDVPPGELRLEAILELPGGRESCTQPFSVAQGDRLILQLGRGPVGAAWDRDQGAVVNDETHPPEITCAETQSLEDMVRGDTTPTGERYVGLTLDKADQKASDEGLTVRLVAEDGMGLGRTDDLVTNRLDVQIWDGKIVAAELPCEQPRYNC